MYLLDTNICICIINKKPPIVLTRLKDKEPGGLAISTITLAELEHGVENSKYPERNAVALMNFLSIMKVLPFDENAAKEYGKIKTCLKKRGSMIGPLDTLIAAHAKSGNFTLVTNNAREFERVEGLKMEDWVQAS